MITNDEYSFSLKVGLASEDHGVNAKNFDTATISCKRLKLIVMYVRVHIFYYIT
jgi:hypothetical protein